MLPIIGLLALVAAIPLRLRSPRPLHALAACLSAAICPPVLEAAAGGPFLSEPMFDYEGVALTDHYLNDDFPGVRGSPARQSITTTLRPRIR